MAGRATWGIGLFAAGCALALAAGVAAGSAQVGPAAGAWVGDYEGPADEGMTAGVSIRRGTAPGRYRVSVGGPGCGGQAEGEGVAAGNQMILTAEEPGQPGQCRVTRARSGARLTMAEGEGCMYFHGANCFFDATLRRRR
jgi:hypothetical protein